MNDTKNVAKKPVRKLAKKPVRKVAKKPVRKVAKKPVRKVAKKPVRKVAKKPVRKVVKKTKANRKPIGGGPMVNSMVGKFQKFKQNLYNRTNPDKTKSSEPNSKSARINYYNKTIKNLDELADEMYNEADKNKKNSNFSEQKPKLLGYHGNILHQLTIMERELKADVREKLLKITDLSDLNNQKEDIHAKLKNFRQIMLHY